MNHRAALLLLGTVMLPLAAGAAGVQVINEDMAAGPAGFDSFYVSPDDSAGNLSFDVLGSAAGGNPGDRLEVLHFHGAVEEPDGNPDGYSIQSVHTYELFSWDPLVDGEILSLSFSVDIESSSPLGIGFSIAQGSRGSLAGFQFIGSTVDWVTLSSGPLDAAEFGGVDFVSGGPLRFGFSMITSSDGFGQTEFAGEQFAANFDNFQVTVTVVPVPAAFWLMFSALGALGLARHRLRASS